MWAEGVHSLVDRGTGALLLYGMRRAGRPADARFPFGYGKEVYFWTFGVALLVFATGGGLSFYEGWRHLHQPGELANPLVNYVVLAIAIAVEGSSWWVAYRQFDLMRGERGVVEEVRRGKDPTVIAVLFEDTAALGGLVVAAAGVWRSYYTSDTRVVDAASMLNGV